MILIHISKGSIAISIKQIFMFRVDGVFWCIMKKLIVDKECLFIDSECGYQEQLM
jgi:hypothetical protein